VVDAIRGFVELLHRNGVRVSIAEALDALRAVEAVGVESPAALEASLAATLVKRQGDAATFAELFRLYFLRRLEVHEADGGRSPLAAALAAEGFSEDEIEELLATLATEAAGLSIEARMAMGVRRPDLALLLRLSGVRLDLLGLASPLQVGFVTHRLLSDLGVLAGEAEVHQLIQRLKPRLGERAEGLVRAADRASRDLRGLLRRAVDDEVSRHERRLHADQHSDLLADKPFAQMSPTELQALRDEVDRLARKLRAAAALRPRLRRRGRLDVRRTLRKALSTGGTPMWLSFRARRLQKPELVLLVDVSDSMRQVARFMLELVFLLQERFAGVRTFAFVSDLGETTELFRRYPVAEAIARAYAGAMPTGRIDVQGNSNVGRALEIFWHRYRDAVTPRATVIVISDGRNNYFPSNAARLADLRTRARRVLWLNPEPPSSWSLGDSAMRDYVPHVDRVEVVYNLAGLRRVIEGLTL
jgi:uncharacterized protein with von Willebrand factor type A (vWA) domain